MANFLTRNITLKILSFVLAIILWFIAIREYNPEITRRFDNVAVTIENENDLNLRGLTLTHRITAETDILLRGRAHDFAEVDSRNFTGYLDLSRITKSGEQTLSIDIRGLPPGMALQSIPQARMLVDSLKTKEIPVEFDVDVTGANGYVVFPYELYPSDSIKILGPSSVLETIKKASVSLTANNATRTIEGSLPVRLMDINEQTVTHEYVDAIPSYIMVVIPVYRTKTLPIVPSIVGAPAIGYEIKSVELFPDEIIVSGLGNVLQSLTQQKTEILDVQNFSTDIRRTLNLKAYEGINIVPGQPSNVDIIVRIDEIIIARTISVHNIEFLNRLPTHDVRIENAIIEVTIRGPMLLVEDIAAENIRIAIDLSEAERGENNLPLILELPEKIELLSVTPQIVTVNID